MAFGLAVSCIYTFATVHRSLPGNAPTPGVQTAPLEKIMSILKERLSEQQNGIAARATGSLRASNELQELKARVHRILINKLDLTKLENADPNVVQNDVKKVIERILDEENAPLSGMEREQVQTDVLNELFGLGPLEPLLADKTISDILVNGSRSVYIERRGRLEKVDVTFRNDAHLLQIIDRIV